MEQEKKAKEEKMNEKVNKEVEKTINIIIEQGIEPNNVDYLYKLVDVHKDLANEEYWNVKKEEMEMRYRAGEYGNYGNYNEGGYGEGSYGRRGMKGTGPYSRYRGGRGSGRYRGEEAIDEMYMNYGEYNEANQSYNEGNYGAEGGMKESAEGIMENIYEIVEELKQTGSPEVMQVIKKYAKKIGQM